MEKLMFKYLNGVYPTAYIYRCKFGEVLYLDNGIVVDNHYHMRRREVVVQLVSYSLVRNRMLIMYLIIGGRVDLYMFDR